MQAMWDTLGPDVLSVSVVLSLPKVTSMLFLNPISQFTCTHLPLRDSLICGRKHHQGSRELWRAHGSLLSTLMGQPERLLSKCRLQWAALDPLAGHLVLAYLVHTPPKGSPTNKLYSRQTHQWNVGIDLTILKQGKKGKQAKGSREWS